MSRYVLDYQNKDAKQFDFEKGMTISDGYLFFNSLSNEQRHYQVYLGSPLGLANHVDMPDNQDKDKMSAMYDSFGIADLLITKSPAAEANFAKMNPEMEINAIFFGRLVPPSMKYNIDMQLVNEFWNRLIMTHNSGANVSSKIGYFCSKNTSKSTAELLGDAKEARIVSTVIVDDDAHVIYFTDLSRLEMIQGSN